MVGGEKGEAAVSGATAALPRAPPAVATAWRWQAALVAVAAALVVLPFRVDHIAPSMTPETLPPKLLYGCVIGIVMYLDRLLAVLTPPNLAVFRQGMGMVHTAELHAVARLRIADAVPQDGVTNSLNIARNITAGGCALFPSSEPRSCESVADRVTRLLRSTSAYGVFAEVPPGSTAWRHTAQSRFLQEAHPASMRSVMLQFGDVQYRMMADLPTTVTTGESGFSQVHREEFWAWYAAHPAEHAIFDDTMHQLGRLGGADAAVARDVPWGKVSVVVDVGGGHGLQAAAILTSNPSLKAVVLDMPHVVARAREVWTQGSASSIRASLGLLPRLSWVGGDMFDPRTVPGAHGQARDLAQAHGQEVCTDSIAQSYGYALRDILHDWPDEDCVRILASLRAVMRTGSASSTTCYGPDGQASVRPVAPGSAPGPSDRVFIIGRLIVPGAGFVESMGSMDADIVMLAAFGTTAGERTVEQYGTLLARAGLAITAVHRTRSHYAIVEAHAV